mmetsp:Transcript_46231/g.91182  ORF Transcript_46231/g.91182 Transcript_46231/m.91182 type:complete len:174 (+) Transcript_46231:832-1353(+)
MPSGQTKQPFLTSSSSLSLSLLSLSSLSPSPDFRWQKVISIASLPSFLPLQGLTDRNSLLTPISATRQSEPTYPYNYLTLISSRTIAQTTKYWTFIVTDQIGTNPSSTPSSRTGLGKGKGERPSPSSFLPSFQPPLHPSLLLHLAPTRLHTLSHEVVSALSLWAHMAEFRTIS